MYFKGQKLKSGINIKICFIMGLDHNYAGYKIFCFSALLWIFHECGTEILTAYQTMKVVQAAHRIASKTLAPLIFRHPSPKLNTRPLNFSNKISIFSFGNLLAKIWHFHTEAVYRTLCQSLYLMSRHFSYHLNIVLCEEIAHKISAISRAKCPTKTSGSSSR